MGDSLQQWRAAIGLHYGSYCSYTNADFPYAVTNKASYFHMLLILLNMLLLIGGVESNPGPDNISNNPESSSNNSVLSNLSSNEKLDILCNGQTQMMKTLETLTGEVSSLKGQFSEVKVGLESANEKINSLQATNRELIGKIDLLENNVRKNNVIVFGLPEKDLNEDSVEIFCDFTTNYMNYFVNQDNIVCAYRIGKKIGKRPLLITLINLKVKSDLMKNASKLKGTGFSISDDLTPSARATKKLLLKSATQARSLNFEVKIRNDFLLIDGKRYDTNMLKNANWINKHKEFLNRDNDANKIFRKRNRDSVSSTDDEMQPGFSGNLRNFEMDPNVNPNSTAPPGNMKPPLRPSEGGMGIETRSRSNSNSSQSRKKK
jgi:hypothetical protein